MIIISSKHRVACFNLYEQEVFRCNKLTFTTIYMRTGLGAACILSKLKQEQTLNLLENLVVRHRTILGELRSVCGVNFPKKISNLQMDKKDTTELKMSNVLTDRRKAV